MIDRLVAERDYLELYDLAQDPTETINQSINLAGQTDLATLERTLLRRLRQWLEQTDVPLLRGPIASPCGVGEALISHIGPPQAALLGMLCSAVPFGST